jgi:hypothetical protein
MRNWLFLFIVIIVVLLFGFSRNDLVASAYLNIGTYQATHDLLTGSDNCLEFLINIRSKYLKKAYESGLNDSRKWTSLFTLIGMEDRQWLYDQEIPRDILDYFYVDDNRLVNQLEIANRLISGPWTCERLALAWRALNIGLVEASSENWDKSVAAYQAGIGVAGGRVPDEILFEYYISLAHYYLSAPNVSAHQRYSAAKYLAFGGELEESLDLLKTIETSKELEGELIDLHKWQHWLINTIDDQSRLPDINKFPNEHRLPEEILESEWSPEWEITQIASAQSSIDGTMLLGFDLDNDILDAGAEVMGTLYWHMLDGSVIVQPFREHNLWTNSGSSWLNLDSYWECLPGYVEPVWVKGCASYQTILNEIDKIRSYTSMIRVTDTDEPDYYIETPGAPIEAGKYYVYGGEWWVDGNFPNPYIARRPLAVENTGSFEVVLDLSSLPQRTWQRAVSLVSFTDNPSESVIWVRPKSGTGTGELRFQNAFSFAVPFIKRSY